MKYYTQKPVKRHLTNSMNKRKFPAWLLIIIAIVILFNSFLYIFNSKIMPSLLSIAEMDMKSEAVKIINQESVKVYSENFNYEDIVKIEKDNEGNITLIRTDTAKQNELASQVVLNCNSKLDELGKVGIKIPLGYVTNNTLFYQLGPNITVKMQQIGNINTSYESAFESAGINQTRHKIYLNVSATIRVVVPLNSKDIDITCQIPVSDTIIVGKIPQGMITSTNGN